MNHHAKKEVLNSLSWPKQTTALILISSVCVMSLPSIWSCVSTEQPVCWELRSSLCRRWVRSQATHNCRAFDPLWVAQQICHPRVIHIGITSLLCRRSSTPESSSMPQLSLWITVRWLQSTAVRITSHTYMRALVELLGFAKLSGHSFSLQWLVWICGVQSFPLVWCAPFTARWYVMQRAHLSFYAGQSLFFRIWISGLFTLNVQSTQHLFGLYVIAGWSEGGGVDWCLSGRLLDEKRHIWWNKKHYCDKSDSKVTWNVPLQLGVMLGGFLSVIIRSVVLQGGVFPIISDSEEGGRLNFWEWVWS